MKKAVLLVLLVLVVSLLRAQPKETLIVLNKSGNTLVFVDPAGMKVLKTLSTGDGPHEVAISGDNKLAYVSNYGSQQGGNSIDVFDIPGQVFVKRIDVGALQRPHGLFEKAGKLYFTCEGSKLVARYDHQSGKIDWKAETGQQATHMIVVTPDGERLYTANIQSNSVSVIEVANPAKNSIVPVEPKPEGIDISPDGKLVWVGHNDDGSISEIETAGNKVTGTFKIGKMPIRVKFAPNQQFALAVDNAGEELIMIDIRTHAVLRRLKLDGSPVGMVISKDSKYVYVSRTRQNRVSKIDLGKFEVAASVETGSNPDGINLAY
ncbi:YncE family protein [Hufsiella ginkgonis]|nr:YncE family protein [Hufsiella ginkgonis]